MKDIKHFMYKNTYEFERFLSATSKRLDDVSGYSVGWKEHYNGNVLRVYIIYLNNSEYKLFRIVYFKNIFECNNARLGVINNKLLMWYDSANIRKYKVKDVWGVKDWYVIEN